MFEILGKSYFGLPGVFDGYVNSSRACPSINQNLNAIKENFTPAINR